MSNCVSTAPRANWHNTDSRYFTLVFEDNLICPDVADESAQGRSLWTPHPSFVERPLADKSTGLSWSGLEWIYCLEGGEAENNKSRRRRRLRTAAVNNVDNDGVKQGASSQQPLTVLPSLILIRTSSPLPRPSRTISTTGRRVRCSDCRPADSLQGDRIDKRAGVEEHPDNRNCHWQKTE